MEEKEEICRTVEKSVLSKLESFGLDFSKKMTIAVAVSGGADSVALLTSLFRLCLPNVTVMAITINHNIRDAEMTEGDADFVQSYCSRLGLECLRVDIPRGKVGEVAKQFDCGIEDAARRLRYEAFENCKSSCGIDYICLAHNKNDQVETVLMRFLSGSDSSGLGGIPSRRGFFLRPLLDVSRNQIESYLEYLGQDFRTDATNFDTAMLRNKIRHKIIPILDTEFPGWQNSVSTLSSKIKDDAFVVEECAKSALDSIDFTYKKNGASLDRNKFLALPLAVRRKIVYKAVDCCGPSSRIPYRFVDEICRGLQNSVDGRKINSSSIISFINDGRIYVQKYVKQATETCFFVTIREAGFYVAGEWKIKAEMDSLEICGDDGQKSVISLPGICFPFIFRSRQIHDQILTSSGTYRSVAKILEDWKCSEADRKRVIVVQELTTLEQSLVALIASPLGYKDWIVKRTNFLDSR